ncbi:MAG: hypothetical protein Ct9H300mP11_33160 [Chloroflexota bacterium]|nr:MAG: hypothetical protein Ct9H300mP11_33160 [Chloroflexota bacterium]
MEPPLKKSNPQTIPKVPNPMRALIVSPVNDTANIAANGAWVDINKLDLDAPIKLAAKKFWHRPPRKLTTPKPMIHNNASLGKATYIMISKK